MKFKKTLPFDLGSSLLANSKRFMNIFFHAFNGLYANEIYYNDTDSLYIENKLWDKLDKSGLVGKNSLHGKNDYKYGGI